MGNTLPRLLWGGPAVEGAGVHPKRPYTEPDTDTSEDAFIHDLQWHPGDVVKTRDEATAASLLDLGVVGTYCGVGPAVQQRAPRTAGEGVQPPQKRLRRSLPSVPRSYSPHIIRGLAALVPEQFGEIPSTVQPNSDRALAAAFFLALGYYVAEGSKFGCDFMLYAEHPDCAHAAYLLSVVGAAPSTQVLCGMIRLAQSVNKALVVLKVQRVSPPTAAQPHQHQASRLPQFDAVSPDEGMLSSLTRVLDATGTSIEVLRVAYTRGVGTLA